MKKSWIPLISVLSIAVVVAVAFVVIAMQKGESSTRTAPESVKFSRGNLNETENDLTASATGSIKRPEARNATEKDHHQRFCRKCCQTPPCWYNNHMECSKCVNQENMKLKLSRLLRRSHKKRIHHQRGKQRMEKHKFAK